MGFYGYADSVSLVVPFPLPTGTHTRYRVLMEETPGDTAPRRVRCVNPRYNGLAIAGFRVKDGWSQPRLAAIVGISPSHLSRIEGEKDYAGMPTLNRIARALSVPVGAILRVRPGETAGGEGETPAETTEAAA